MSKQFVRLKNVRPRRLQLGRHRGVRGLASDIDSLRLEGRAFRGFVSDAVRSGQLVRTMRGASTVTLDLADDSNRLVQSPLFKHRFDVTLDDLWFRYTTANDDGAGTLSITFESRDIARLRRQRGHVKVLRDKVTRAEFALYLIRELKNPRVPMFSPELHVVQPIRSRREARRERPQKDERREPGFDSGTRITVKNQAASQEQLRNIQRVLDVGMSLKAPKRVLVAAVACITQESFAINLTHGDAAGPDSRGLFQQRPSTGWPGDPRDIENAATNFFRRAPTYSGGAIAYNRNNPNAPMQDLINAIQRSADKSLYIQWFSEARRTVETYLGGAAAGGRLEVQREVPYTFERRKGESTWDCLTRLANEVQWVLFESNGLIYYVSEDYLMRSRVRMRLSDDAPGVDSIACSYNSNLSMSEVRVVGRAREWAAPPGTVAVLRGRGPADGRYLVREIRSDLFSDHAEILLDRPTPALPEPPAEIRTISAGAGGPRRTLSPGAASTPSGIRIVGSSSGAPHWGGSAHLFHQFITPFLNGRYGYPIRSQKRPNNSGSGISDHWVGSTMAYAVDYATYTGGPAARALASALGQPGWEPGGYGTFNITGGGFTFRIQILWQSDPDHYDHIHVGARRL